MDQTTRYADILTQILRAESRIQFRTIPRLKIVASCDRESGQFLLVMVGWDNKNHWEHSILFHAQLIDGKVLIEADNTEGLKPQLLEAGIRAEDFLDDRDYDYSTPARTAA
jgi:hypothetical protein